MRVIRRRSRGVALVAALLVMVILVIIAGSFVAVMSRDIKTTKIMGDSQLNLYAAEAGLEYAFWLHKHNMEFYPSVAMVETQVNADGSGTVDVTYEPGQIYNLPYSQTSGYTPEKERFNKYNNRFDVEHVFVNDMAFEGDNWLADRKFCSTFQIRENYVRANSEVTLTIVSTGRLRQVPNGWDWFTGEMSTQKLEDLGFTEHSERTLSAILKLQDKKLLTGSSSLSFPSSDSNRYDFGLQKRNWREWFR